MSAIELSGVTVPGRAHPRLDAVDLSCEPGTLTVVIGPNGAGKSTLIRAIAGLQPIASGTLTLGGTAVSDLTRSERAARIAWLAQNQRLEEGLTALEVVAAARYRFAEAWAVSRDEAARALDAMGAAAWAEYPMDRLSGGEAQRVRLASLAAQGADWWLLDEPANHLDPAVRLELLGRIEARAAQGGGVVLVTHDLSMLAHLGDARVVALDRGRVAHRGGVSDPELAGALGELFGLELRSVEVDGAQRLVIVGGRS